MLLAVLAAYPPQGSLSIDIERPMPPPAWALAERALLQATADGAAVFAEKYLDRRGYLRCVERWGGNDGPDDAMENFSNWPLLYALGGTESVLDLYRHAWEGHLRQYTEARAPGIEMAEDGMYDREFITAFDWEHTGEALAAFHFYGLGRPTDPTYLDRVRRFAGFYTGNDPEANNYDPEQRIVRSLHNGSRGPKLSPATPEDWGGLPVPGAPERLTRYATAGNIRGDHPLNLCATALVTNAYMLTREDEYRSWVLEYAGAWRERILQNDGNIPTNIGLDGTIGGEWDGKWYGGVFGWDFWPQTAARNYYIRGPRIGLGAALLLSGDPAFAKPLRRQIANLYAARRTEDGQILLPNKHGDDGWYGYTPNQHFDVQRDLYLWSLDRGDLQWLGDDPWIAYLEGRNADYPLEALQAEIATVRERVEGLRRDDTPEDQRPSDAPQRFNPVTTTALVNLTLGGNDPGTAGNLLHSRVRYFDPEARRAGLPEDVAALVERITPEGIALTLVNTNQVEPRTVVVQTGAYAEHLCRSVTIGAETTSVDASTVLVRLAPGAGDTLTLALQLFARQPTLAFPWDR